jgi:ATP-dependent helicase Lhr and Lhr-like helicase
VVSSFHPLVYRWFRETLGEPTPAQAQGWAAIRERRHTLIAAPTGSGKTLAAFLTALDDLVKEAEVAPLPNEVRVIYVSPLKALSADIHKNLAEPRRGIRRLAEESGRSVPRITAAVRTGDTPQTERAAMLRTPPHILVTTPESLYLLLTADRSREMLRTARTVIVDEIHAVIGTRRGAHLALTLERLQEVVNGPLLRLGLSATQKPIEEVARFLVGTHAVGEGGDAACAIVNEGHRRAMALALEVPRSPLEAVMSHEVWSEYYDRLTELIAEHRTTLVFVNTRRMAERLARQLSDRVGEDAVTAHHGSLSKEKRLDAEARLKAGALKALVATASLELGIDIGSVDLVCQIGSPRRIATFLQRVGRSGHSVSGLPKGRLFPISRDDLIECAALLQAVRRGELDQIVSQEAPLDVLAQQLVAETACAEYDEDALFALARRAWPYRNLARRDFDTVLTMTAEGFATRRGRRSALVHRDEVNRKVRARRGSRMLAITSGGAIPEVADYRVLLEPEDTFIGTLNEDFAIESTVGDVFQLGNASWQVLQVGAGFVRVADAKGAPPNLPFWLGEAPGRSDELSRAVSDLRAAVGRGMRGESTDGGAGGPGPPLPDSELQEMGLQDIAPEAAEQIVAYLGDAKRALGVMPTQETLVLERFFDESGGMQLVIHAPFGSRINKAWGLALRKRFCRQFNFELQAAATEDGLLLSLGPQHSFPLADVFGYLHPATARDILVQAFLDAPVFKTRWRWNTNLSLAVPRNRAGKKIAPQLQRMLADDLMAAVFPDATACLENIPGDRVIPDHPLVSQTVRDCLQEAMDFDGLATVLSRIHRGELQLVARDTAEPSPLAHELLNARPYAFLDDAPLEERRAHAVYARRAGGPVVSELGALDRDAIARVVDDARPDPRDADELHDALLTTGVLVEADVNAPADLFERLAELRRATRIALPGVGERWVAAERLPELRAVHADAAIHPHITAPATRTTRAWTRSEALVELVRGRMTIVGPTTASELATSIGVTTGGIDEALLALEAEGVVLRGRFAASEEMEWCDRRLLARIHHYTLNRLRAEIEAVSPADFTRFLFSWQHVDALSRVTGLDGLRAIVQRLDGYEVAASAWERAVFPARMDRYDTAMLDVLCLTGEVGWARLSRGPAAMVSATPIALFLRAHLDAWITLRAQDDDGGTADARSITETATRVLDVLVRRGASFLNEVAATSALAPPDAAAAIGELVAAGLVTSDGFAGLRTLIHDGAPASSAGRWSLVQTSGRAMSAEDALEQQAWSLLHRYGVVFRRLLVRESNAAPWRALARVYRRLELRGDIRGGRFVSGMTGEQFALPAAVTRLRETRRTPADGRLIVISAADPLNLAGILTSGDRVRAVASTRIIYRDGVPLAALEGDYMRQLAPIDAAIAGKVASALTGRPTPPVVSGFIGRVG